MRNQMMQLMIIVCLVWFIHPAFAQQESERGTVEKPAVEGSSVKGFDDEGQEDGEDAVDEIGVTEPAPEDEPKPDSEPDAAGDSYEVRAQRQHTFAAVYSLMDTWVPSKWGLSYSFHPSPLGAFEIEYLRGSLGVPFLLDDLGGFSEQRVSLLYRSFQQRNSFHFFYGANYNSFEVHLGSEFIGSISGGKVGKYDVLTLETLGLTWGFGNRWYFDNQLVVGVDWLALHWPVYVLESGAAVFEANVGENEKETIRDVLDIVEDIPAFSVLKVHIGMSF